VRLENEELATLYEIIINNVIVILDIPASVSLPHFYNSDPSLVHEVEGINPVKEKHETIIIMQPVRAA
jgi:CD36 family